MSKMDEAELQKNYEEFYDDVFAEWSKFGKIIQFKVTYLFKIFFAC